MGLPGIILFFVNALRPVGELDKEGDGRDAGKKWYDDTENMVVPRPVMEFRDEVGGAQV